MTEESPPYARFIGDTHDSYESEVFTFYDSADGQFAVSTSALTSW